MVTKNYAGCPRGPQVGRGHQDAQDRAAEAGRTVSAAEGGEDGEAGSGVRHRRRRRQHCQPHHESQTAADAKQWQQSQTTADAEQSQIPESQSPSHRVQELRVIFIYVYGGVKSGGRYGIMEDAGRVILQEKKRHAGHQTHKITFYLYTRWFTATDPTFC